MGQQKPADLEAITRLLKDPAVVRLVTVLDIASLSVLELMEYGLTRRDVNHALTGEIIEVDKKTETPPEELLVSGDTYFYQFLNSKVRLTELGMHLLDCIRGSKSEQEMREKAGKKFGSPG